MRVAITILMLTFGLSAMAMDSAGKYAVWGVGSKACFTYSKDKKAGHGQKYRDYEMGYLTAYNRITPETYNISGKMDLEAVDAWVGDFCKNKPMNSFEQAMTNFVHDHIKSRYRVAPLSSH